jgi:hypothetical protein
LAAFILEHSVTGAVKAVKLALKSEFTTDIGRINLVGMILFVILLFFTNLHQMVAAALSVDKPPPSENDVLAPAVLFGLGFVLSLICVLIVERKKSQ